MPAAVSGASEEYSSLLSLQNRADKLKEVEAELELRKEVRAERGRRKKMVDGDGKVLVYKLDGVSEDRNVNVYKPLEGEERVMLKCPMAKRMSPSEEVLTQYVLEYLPKKVRKQPAPFRMIELGAGLGLAGLSAAAAMPNGLDIYLTDGDDKVKGQSLYTFDNLATPW
ncbi:hypothetical protein Pmar_PMAR016306 [Perkinsus marinus ATCC 50983]|uniref:Calmodulin-lysine N-methyltransferase n=1 Tax=Perkinsus marinus (strain ATCC 50983 / TXsc) TaxID=423536 RepID=C5LFH0_PERM5|nr:hypothetical protein Pmar_PMAR016306 [Perkinsus marinus ATCC 50983]EER04522.1 hypothetical protein Pmar_PMAR016306 [Perkinsus marinus ATCC 50983]|eukprot:XP_002772706.1 hypothetical protein Pmar_PMAR016306 [Perkinsus marinus ATCC 50983]